MSKSIRFFFGTEEEVLRLGYNHHTPLTPYSVALLMDDPFRKNSHPPMLQKSSCSLVTLTLIRISELFSKKPSNNQKVKEYRFQQQIIRRRITRKVCIPQVSRRIKVGWNKLFKWHNNNNNNNNSNNIINTNNSCRGSRSILIYKNLFFLPTSNPSHHLRL